MTNNKDDRLRLLVQRKHAGMITPVEQAELHALAYGGESAKLGPTTEQPSIVQMDYADIEKRIIVRGKQ